MANRASDRSSGHRQGLRVSKSATTKQDRPPVSSRRSARVAPPHAVLGQPPWMKIRRALDPDAQGLRAGSERRQLRRQRDVGATSAGSGTSSRGRSDAASPSSTTTGPISATTRRSTSTTIGSSRAAASTRRNRIRASISKWCTRLPPKRSRSSRPRSVERSIGGAPTVPWPVKKGDRTCDADRKTRRHLGAEALSPRDGPGQCVLQPRGAGHPVRLLPRRGRRTRATTCRASASSPVFRTTSSRTR